MPAINMNEREERRNNIAAMLLKLAADVQSFAGPRVFGDTHGDERQGAEFAT